MLIKYKDESIVQTFTYEMLAKGLTSDKVEERKKTRKLCQELFKSNPENASFLHFLATVDFDLGHFDQAAQWMKKCVALMPDSAELLCTYAQMLVILKKYSEAITALNQSIVLKPDYAAAHYGLGSVYRECGNDAEAIKSYNNALALQPNYPEVLNDLGVIFQNQGKMAEAAMCFSRAIAEKPDYSLAFNNFGYLYFTSGNLDNAEKLYSQALVLKPDYPDALNNLGTVYNRRGAIEESISCYKKALAIQPNYPNALSNLGTVYHDMGAFDKSIPLYRKALFLQPNHPEALNNLGNALEAIGKLSEAINSYTQAIVLKENCPEYNKNLAMALLAAGQFDEGWKKYEWRWKTSQFDNVFKDATKPRWNGKDAQGRTLLIRAEQGFGDTLQFCRYAPLAAMRGLRVILEVQSPLVNIMKSLPGIEQVIAQGNALPDFDFYCPMMSLPAAFNTTLETIPCSVPYLGVNGESVEKWRDRLQDDAGKMLKVGLVWSGKPRAQSPDLIAVDRRRSMSPELLAPLINVSGIKYYSLQKTGQSAPREFGFIDYMDECSDFSDTAALIANLDLVISVDTAVAHLAGALGKPVWILNRFDSCWRWFKEREDSPWYPTLRLIRQPEPGDWKSVILRAENDLCSNVAKNECE